MITPETRLSQIAPFLGRETAELLIDAPPAIQELVLTSVKWALIGFESQGPLDPITLQETLHDFVVSILAGSPDD